MTPVDGLITLGPVPVLLTVMLRVTPCSPTVKLESSGKEIEFVFRPSVQVTPSKTAAEITSFETGA